MSQHELAHLELLAEIDGWVGELRHWIDRAPAWPPAAACVPLLRRLIDRVTTLRTRLEAPLLVAMLGGSGTGKSTLVNALCGAELTTAGRQRPTTREPVLITRRGVTPEQLGLNPESVQWKEHDFSVAADLALLDCPDPDTTESSDADRQSNLARLRRLLPHCDVLLVTSTQQKYNDERWLSVLRDAAPGARLVFVQTHADQNDDIRDDWRQRLAPHYDVGEMFLIDGPAALSAMQGGLGPLGEFRRLIEFLSRELAPAAAHRIRRANFFDLADATLSSCRRRMAEASPAIGQLESALSAQRASLANAMAKRFREELLGNRRAWENRLLAEMTGRWGLSPFALVLRIYQALGSLASGLLLWRARTPVQLALWGAWQADRSLRGRKDSADVPALTGGAWSWNETELRTSAIILTGYAREAGLDVDEGLTAHELEQAGSADRRFVATAGQELSALVRKLAARHAGTLVRAGYELALLAMLGMILARMAKNFFYDSWLPAQPSELYDLRFFIHALFWIMLWSMLLVAMFTRRLRRGLEAQVDALVERWNTPASAAGLFQSIESQLRAVRQAERDLERLAQSAHVARHRLETAPDALGHRLTVS